jgi:hypothetical protein
MDPFLEIDFHLYNFGLGINWENYRLYSNIPNAMHDTAASDLSLTEQTPAATGIWTSSLEKDKTYYVMITWSAPNAQVGATKVGIGWTPSYWPNPIDHPFEFGLCTAHGADPRWCIFGDKESGHTYDLTKDKFRNAYPPEGHLPVTNTYTWRSFGGWNSTYSSGSSPGGGVTTLPSVLPQTSGSAPTPPPPPVVQQVKRTVGPSGEAQVYASTKCAATEAWWKPGGDGIHTSEIIHISQCNITGIDKASLPEGKQSLYTAVPDGVWETWWDASHNPASAKIVSGLSGMRQVIANNRWETQGYTHRLYLLASDGPYEVWWRDGGDGIHVNRLDAIANPVTMAKSTGPSGEDQLYVATATWVYELYWRPDQSVRHSALINITQGDINSLSKVLVPGGQQRLFTGTSTGVWQSIWQNSAPSHNPQINGQTGLLISQVMQTDGTFQGYIATNNTIREYWWNGGGSGNGVVVSLGGITTFVKYNDGGFQQVYTGTNTGKVYETYWGGGQGPKTSVLFGVAR